MEKGIILSPTITRPTEKTLKVRGHERGSAGGIHNNIGMGQRPESSENEAFFKNVFSKRGRGWGGVGRGRHGPT